MVAGLFFGFKSQPVLNRFLYSYSSQIINKLTKKKTRKKCETKMENSVSFKLVFVLFALFICLGKTAEKESKDPLVKAFKTLNAEEKTHFISYFLAHGLKDWAQDKPRPPKLLTLHKPDKFIKAVNISNEKIEKFEKMNIPSESRKKLLQWTKTEFNLTTTNIVQLLRSRNCPRSPCLPDIGELCCPW